MKVKRKKAETLFLSTIRVLNEHDEATLVYHHRERTGESMADDNKMSEKTKQERYRQEDEMARGPVSRGVSNKDAPMYQKGRRSTSTAQNKDRAKNPDYNKMIEQRTSGTSQGTGMETDRVVGSAAGGTMPNPGRGTGQARGGGMASSNSVAGRGTSAGGLIGEGYTRDRGTMPTRDVDTSTNNADEITREGRGQVPTRIANAQPDNHPPRKTKRRK